MFVRHPVLKPDAVEFRGFQANLARIAGQKDTLVVVPTGMGKTIVALLVIADALHAGAKRILILAPTRPLVEQHASTLQSLMAAPWNERVHALTGLQGVEKRETAYAQPGVVVATPQVVQNDVVSGRLKLGEFDWVVFDEAHRAVGDYPYTFLGQEIQTRHPTCRRLGLTASPGYDVKKIQDVRAHLGLGHVEIRSPDDPDVAPYVQHVDMEWETLPLPPTMGRVSKLLHEALAERVRSLRSMGHLKQSSSRPSRRDLLELGGALGRLVAKDPRPDTQLFVAMSVQAQAMKILHAIEQAETQGASAFVEYLHGLREEAQGPKPTKATKMVVEDARINEAYHVARHDTSENPKLGRAGVLVQEQLEKEPESRIIFFTHYRATSEMVCEHLGKLPGVKPVVFVGQGRRAGQAGMTQKQQQGVLEAFRQGAHNVLVATSVAEEGLDVPGADLVIFFEPIPSEIRSIQRRGRTGRHRPGRVVVLMTKGTQDEAAHYVARRKEQAMVRELQGLRAGLGQASALTLASFEAGSPALDSAKARARSQPPGTSGAFTDPPSSAQTSVGRSPVQSSSPSSASDGASGAGVLTPAGSGREAAADASVPDASGAATGPVVYYDLREQSGGIVKHLHQLGARLEGRQLDVGDFVLSDRVAVERKTCADFVDSLVDGRLFDQVKQLRAYPRPFLIVEGESLHGHRNVAPEALWAAMSSITVDFGIPLLQTRDGLETARFLFATAKREQERDGRKLALRQAKPLPLDEAQRYLMEGLPGISAVLARRLLQRFGSPAGVFAASATDLAKVDGIGPGKADEIRRILETDYAPKSG